MITIKTSRPRNINYWRAAGILYGDWGTSKAYILGLAFALATFSTFWFILSVSILTLCVGLNYILICKMYPNGGGVYSSTRERSEALSVIGAFFLISDYLVTAALSALSAFHYLGVSQPEIWAIAAIGIIGIVNFFGPKHSGSMAVALAIPTVIVIICLGAMSLSVLPLAISNLTPIPKDMSTNWSIFVGMIVALSGVEAIANMTGSMKLDPGSTTEKPSVVKTSTPALIMVMAEVCIFSTLLALAMNALPNLTVVDGDVHAPGYPNVRDAMLNYMGEVFAGHLFGIAIGHLFSAIVSIVITLLLLSAVNTAIVAFTSLLYILSKDEELPRQLQKLNYLGNPLYATAVAFGLPMILLMCVSDIANLVDLYAIGFVGAIAVNLGTTATNFNLPLKKLQRYFMFTIFIVMGCIEITLFIDKPHARNFVATIVGLGLFSRMLIKEQKQKKLERVKNITLPELPEHTQGSMLVAVTGKSKSLDYALKTSQIHQMPLYILFVREQKIISDEDRDHSWLDDEEACEVFDYVCDNAKKNNLGFLYTVTSDSAHSIIEIAQKKKVNSVIMGKRRHRSSLAHYLSKNAVRDVTQNLPEHIELVVVY